MAEAPQPSSGDPGTSSQPSASSNGAQSSSEASVASAGEFPLRTLADAPVDNDAADRFGYGDIADGLARLIDGEQTATPLTIALSAPWGAGKTSLLRLVEDRVVRQKAARHEAPTIVVWFNAWMHDAAPNLSAALAADIARKATSCRDPWTRLWHPLPSSMLSPKERARRKFWLGVVALVSAVLIYPFLSAFIGPSHADITKVRAVSGPRQPVGSYSSGASASSGRASSGVLHQWRPLSIILARQQRPDLWPKCRRRWAN